MTEQTPRGAPAWGEAMTPDEARRLAFDTARNHAAGNAYLYRMKAQGRDGWSADDERLLAVAWDEVAAHIATARAASPAPEVLQGEQSARDELENGDGGRAARQRSWERETGAPGNYTLHLAFEKLNHLGCPALSEAVRRVAQENVALRSRSVQQDARDLADRLARLCCICEGGDVRDASGAVLYDSGNPCPACEAAARLRSPST